LNTFNFDILITQVTLVYKFDETGICDYVKL